VLFSPLVAVLIAAATPAQQVLVMDLEAVGVADNEASAATRVVAAAAAEVDGVVVMSAADLRRLAQLEGEKANVGCTNDTDCLADIAGALGAERVIFGSLSRLGSTTTVVLSLYEVQTHQATRRSFDVADLNGLSALLRANTTSLLTGSSLTTTAPPPTTSSSRNVVPLALGIGAGVVGGATAGLMDAFIQDKNASGDAKETYRLIGYGGLGLAAVGVVVAVVGGVIFVGGEQ